MDRSNDSPHLTSPSLFNVLNTQSIFFSYFGFTRFQFNLTWSDKVHSVAVDCRLSFNIMLTFLTSSFIPAEMLNGRLAMMGIVGTTVFEIISGHPVVQMVGLR